MDIFHAAVTGRPYSCLLNADEVLPMMFMGDAVWDTIELMQAPLNAIRERGSYNVAGLSFSPQEIAAEIQRQGAALAIHYAADYRQDIAAGWPDSINDDQAL